MTSEQKIYFSLAPSLSAAQYENTIIILDIINDKYLSLIDEAAAYLNIILSHSFIHDHDGHYSSISGHEDMLELNEWIAYFCENNFISASSTPHHNYIAASPLKKGGLCNYQWDLKTSWAPFTQTSKIQVMQAFMTLTRVHWIIKRQGIKGLFNIIEKNIPSHTPLINPNPEQLAKLIATVDSATLLYPQKTFCLAWATTFVILALRKKWDIRLVIGVQAQPFYAHAWAQTNDGTVIHDDVQVGQVLSKIAVIPFVRK